MRSFIVLVAALLMVPPLAWSFTSGAQPALKPYTLGSPVQIWTAKIEAKKVQAYQLDEVYNLQVNYPEEKVIDLSLNNYLIQFTSDSVAQYYGTEMNSPDRYLREVSGNMLGLVLYRLGGDGTDHYQDCHSSLFSRLPKKQFSATEAQWSATYSGLFVDFAGACSGRGGSTAYYVFVQVTFDPVAQTGEIFIGGEDLTGKNGSSVDLFHVNLE